MSSVIAASEHRTGEAQSTSTKQICGKVRGLTISQLGLLISFILMFSDSRISATHSLNKAFLSMCPVQGAPTGAKQTFTCPQSRRAQALSLVTINPVLINRGASLVAQLLKNLPAMQEAQVQSLGQEDPLEKGMAIHSSILA